ncbi:hypothetical protein MRX96_038416 [Rhipicephalus microplus]
MAYVFLSAQILKQLQTMTADVRPSSPIAHGSPCVSCEYLRKALQTRKSRLKRKAAKRTSKRVNRLQTVTKSVKRLASKVHCLSDTISRMKDATAATAEDIFTAEVAKSAAEATASYKPANAYKQQQLIDLLLDEGDLEGAEGSLHGSSLTAPDHPPGSRVWTTKQTSLTFLMPRVTPLNSCGYDVLLHFH